MEQSIQEDRRSLSEGGKRSEIRRRTITTTGRERCSLGLADDEEEEDDLRHRNTSRFSKAPLPSSSSSVPSTSSPVAGESSSFLGLSSSSSDSYLSYAFCPGREAEERRGREQRAVEGFRGELSSSSSSCSTASSGGEGWLSSSSSSCPCCLLDEEERRERERGLRFRLSSSSRLPRLNKLFTSALDRDRYMDRSIPNLLIAGLPRSGKSSIARVVFQQTPPHETFHYEGFHNHVEVIPVECGGSFLKFIVAVLPGSFVLDVERTGVILSSSSSTSAQQHRRGETSSSFSSSFSSHSSSYLPSDPSPWPRVHIDRDRKNLTGETFQSLKTTGSHDPSSSLGSSYPSASHSPSRPCASSCIVTGGGGGRRRSCGHFSRRPSSPLSSCLHSGVSSPPPGSEGTMGGVSPKTRTREERRSQGVHLLSSSSSSVSRETSSSPHTKASALHDKNRKRMYGKNNHDGDKRFYHRTVRDRGGGHAYEEASSFSSVEGHLFLSPPVDSFPYPFTLEERRREESHRHRNLREQEEVDQQCVLVCQEILRRCQSLIFVVDIQSDTLDLDVLHAVGFIKTAWLINPHLYVEVFLHKSEADYFGLGEFALDVVERLHEQIQGHLSFHLAQEISPPPLSSSQSQQNTSSSSSSCRSYSPSTREMKTHLREGEEGGSHLLGEESEEDRTQEQRRMLREHRGSERGQEDEEDVDKKRFSVYKAGEGQSDRSDSGDSSSRVFSSPMLNYENSRSFRCHEHAENKEKDGGGEEEEREEEEEEGYLGTSVPSFSCSDGMKASLKNCHSYGESDQLSSSSPSSSSRLKRLSFSATCLYDSSIFQACSRSVQRLFRCHEVCTELLDALVASCRMDKALLVDSAVRLCLASDSSPFDSSLFELAAEVVDVARELKAVYSPPGERPQWLSPSSDLPPPPPSPSSPSLSSSTPSSSRDDEEEDREEEEGRDEEGETEGEKEKEDEDAERRRQDRSSGGRRKSLVRADDDEKKRTSHARREDKADEGGVRKAEAIEKRESREEDVRETERKKMETRPGMARRRRTEEEEEGEETLQGEEGEQDNEEKRREVQRKGAEDEKEEDCKTHSSYCRGDRSTPRRKEEEKTTEEQRRGEEEGEAGEGFLDAADEHDLPTPTPPSSSSSSSFVVHRDKGDDGRRSFLSPSETRGKTERREDEEPVCCIDVVRRGEEEKEEGKEKEEEKKAVTRDLCKKEETGKGTEEEGKHRDENGGLQSHTKREDRHPTIEITKSTGLPSRTAHHLLSITSASTACPSSSSLELFSSSSSFSSFLSVNSSTETMVTADGREEEEEEESHGREGESLAEASSEGTKTNEVKDEARERNREEEEEETMLMSEEDKRKERKKEQKSCWRSSHKKELKSCAPQREPAADKSSESSSSSSLSSSSAVSISSQRRLGDQEEAKQHRGEEGKEDAEDKKEKDDREEHRGLCEERLKKADKASSSFRPPSLPPPSVESSSSSSVSSCCLPPSPSSLPAPPSAASRGDELLSAVPTESLLEPVLLRSSEGKFVSSFSSCADDRNLLLHEENKRTTECCRLSTPDQDSRGGDEQEEEEEEDSSPLLNTLSLAAPSPDIKTTKSERENTKTPFKEAVPSNSEKNKKKSKKKKKKGSEGGMKTFCSRSDSYLVHLTSGQMLCVTEVKKSLVVACVFREEVFDRQYLVDRNLRVFKNAVLELIEIQVEIEKQQHTHHPGG